MSDSLILQRHEAELEKCVTSIHSVSLCLGLFFKADWSKRGDPFYFQSCSVGTLMDGEGLLGGHAESNRIERRGKGSANFLQGLCSALIPFLHPHPVASISIAATL